MRTFITLTIAVALLVSVAPVMAQSAADEAAIRKLVEQEIAAYNKHDAKAANAMYAEDYENWAGTRKGRAASEKSDKEFFEGSGKTLHIETEEIGIIFVTPDVAIYKERVESTHRLDEEGKPLPPRKSLYAAVYVRRNGKWLVAAAFNRTIEE